MSEKMPARCCNCGCSGIELPYTIDDWRKGDKMCQGCHDSFAWPDWLFDASKKTYTHA